MKGNRFFTGAFVAVLATVVGCTLTIDFDPRGIDVSLEGDWLINGAPADVASCTAAGIDTVQLVFWDGGIAYEYNDFRFNCEDGFFDTGTRGVLDHGRYQTQWIAYDATGTRFDPPGPMVPLDVSGFDVDHAILTTVDFIVTGTPGFNPMGSDGSLEADWTINGNPADAAGCALGDIVTMNIIFYDIDDTARTAGITVASAPCADGFFDSRPTSIIAMGDYLTRIEAIDSTGASVGAFDSEFPLVVSAIDHYALMTAPFDIAPPPNEMVVDIAWSPGDTDCATAGVDSILWALNDTGTGSTVLDDAAATCASVGDRLTFSDLPAGTYELFVDAESADRLTKWQGTCDMLVHDGLSTAYNCFYDIMP